METTNTRSDERAEKGASYCCEAAEIIPASTLPLEDAFAALPHPVTSSTQSASYCCEAAEVLPVTSLPDEDVFEAE